MREDFQCGIVGVSWSILDGLVGPIENGCNISFSERKYVTTELVRKMILLVA